MMINEGTRSRGQSLAAAGRWEGGGCSARLLTRETAQESLQLLLLLASDVGYSQCRCTVNTWAVVGRVGEKWWEARG